MVNIVSMNVNRLHNNVKRKEVFLYCKRSKFDIILMQETHSEKSQESIWENEWGGKIIFDNGESNARGTTIIF